MDFYKKDPTWKVFEVDNRQEFVDRIVPDIIFKEQVSEHIIKEWNTIHHLIALSYYKYQLMDVALDKALMSMEMASKIRFKEIHPGGWKGKFGPLLNKLHDMNMFDASKEQLNHIRKLRNHSVHPDRHSFMGPGSLSMIRAIIRLINELHDDLELRLERRALQHSLEHFWKSIPLGVWTYKTGNHQSTLSQLTCFLIDNKEPKPVYYFLVTPTFDLSQYINSSEGGIDVPDSWILAMSNVQFRKKSIRGYELLSEQVGQISITQDKVRLKRYANWEQLLSRATEKHPNLLFNPLLSKVRNDILNDFVLKDKLYD